MQNKILILIQQLTKLTLTLEVSLIIFAKNLVLLLNVFKNLFLLVFQKNVLFWCKSVSKKSQKMCFVSLRDKFELLLELMHLYLSLDDQYCSVCLNLWGKYSNLHCFIPYWRKSLNIGYRSFPCIVNF